MKGRILNDSFSKVIWLVTFFSASTIATAVAEVIEEAKPVALDIEKSIEELEVQ